MEEIKEFNFVSIKLINDYDYVFVKYFNQDAFDKNSTLKIAVHRDQIREFYEFKTECLIIDSNNRTLNFKPFTQETNCKLYLIKKSGLWCLGRNARSKISNWK